MKAGCFGAVAACVALLSTNTTALDVYYVGNSHTDEAIGMMNIAMGFGVENSKVGRCMVPGSPLWLLYQDRNEKSGHIWYDGNIDWSSSSEKLPQVLTNHDWDAVVLQVFPRNGDNLEKTAPAVLGFAELIYAGNPDCQILIMTSHAYAFSSDGEWATHMGCVSSIYEPLADLVSTTWPQKKTVRVIPVLQVLNAVRNEIDAGTSPFLGTFESFYQENGTDAHVDKKGLYVHALTNYTTIYRANPVGAVTSGIYYWKYPDGYAVDEPVASYAQSLVWDMVVDYPAAGVDVDPVSVRSPTSAASRYSRMPGAPVDLLGRLMATGISRRGTPGWRLVVRNGHTGQPLPPALTLLWH